MSDLDRVTISLDFKLSQNYQSFGGALTISSSAQPGETVDELEERVRIKLLEKMGKLNALAAHMLQERVKSR